MNKKQSVGVYIQEQQRGLIPHVLFHLPEKGFVSNDRYDFYVSQTAHDYRAFDQLITISSRSSYGENTINPCAAPFAMSRTGNSVFVSFFSMPKNIQATIIKATAKLHNFDRIRLVRTEKSLEFCQDDGVYVMKPNFGGARGICQTLIDLRKHCPAELDDQIRTSVTYQEFERKTGLQFTMGTSHRHAGEDDNRERWRSNDFFFTEYISDVISEYRVITDWLGRPHLCMKRKRENLDISTYYQGHGIDGEIYRFNNKEEFCAVMGSEADQIYDFLVTLNQPLHSFDLFTTLDASGVRFGIFEFSPEWGCVGLPHPLLATYAVNFLDRMANYGRKTSCS